jgi:protocatechuate 3,4-dioxygenase beta subunit
MYNNDDDAKTADVSRRKFLKGLVAIPGAMFIGVAVSRAGAFGFMRPAPLPPTPDCGDDDDVTPRQTAGPFYTPNSPQRTSLLESGITGTKILLTGQVLTTECKPVANTLVDFWHANENGEYDNDGFKLRGHQFTDANGKYRLESIVPGAYPGRTRHFHVRVQAPNQRILTTQLYFPDEPRNKTDWIFNPALLMDVKGADKDKSATFDFILRIA